METNEKYVCLVLADYIPNVLRLYEAPAFSVTPGMIVETEDNAGAQAKNAITINAELYPDVVKFIVDFSGEKLPLKKVTATVTRKPLSASSFNWSNLEEKQGADDEH